MKFTQSIIAVAVVGAFGAGTASADLRPRNLADMFGDYHATTGHEVTVPQFVMVDANADGYPENIKIRYRVFSAGQAGNTTPLHLTPFKTVATPALPAGCDPAQAADELDIELVVRRRDSQLDSSGILVDENKRMHIGVNMEVDCFNGSEFVWAQAGAVYSADLSGAAATTWVKAWQGRIIEGINGVDLDDDLVSDAVMITHGGPTATGWNLGIVYARGADGKISTDSTTVNTNVSGGGLRALPVSNRTYVIVQ